MVKRIELSLAQQDELLNVDMTSFRESSLRQSIRDTNKWWIANFLPDNAVIQRVDRIGELTYQIQFYCQIEINDLHSYHGALARHREKSGFGM